MNNNLAVYASDPAQSRGRRYQVEGEAQPQMPEFRNAFQRDRDRVVHSSAFRRLVYKTQVFLNHEGDLFRTRLTHSLEVAQLARSIARALQLHEDLVEAIALAHDLGHTPFGHAGQDALNACMQDSGGFEHNLQSLRVVDWLELRYPQHAGLNLCFETREGILKHCSPRNAQLLEQQEPDGVGRRFLDNTRPSLEAQLCNLADEIAYNAHDMDDGVRSGLLTMEQVQQVPLFAQHCAQALQQHPELAQSSQQRRLLYEALRRMLSAMVHDVIAASRHALAALRPGDAQAVRRAPPLIVFGAEMAIKSKQLKHFLLQNLYRHPDVMQTTSAAQQVLRELFTIYSERPREAGDAVAAACAAADSGAAKARLLADYLAGMTDRFALRAHERLTGKRLFPQG